MATTKRTNGLHLYLAAAPSTTRHALMALNTPTAEPAKFLLSYHYFKKMDLDELVDGMGQKPMLFADSGAFSALTQGADVNINEYAAWIKRWQHLLTVYVNLDVIRDAKATATNQKRLEQLGLQPIPVFHTGSDFKHLDKLVKTYPYIALGGMVGAEAQPCFRWAATCMKRTQEYGTCFHGFGQTRKQLIANLPWYSVDSSSWGSGHRYGALDIWTGKEFAKIKIGNKASVYKHAITLRKYGVDPVCLSDRGRYHQKYAIRISAQSWHDYEQHLRRRHGMISCQSRAPGLHLYLVDGAKTNLQDAGKAINKHKESK